MPPFFASPIFALISLAVLLPAANAQQSNDDPVSELTIEALESGVKASYQTSDRDNLQAATQRIADWLRSRSEKQLDTLTESQLAWLIKALTLFNFEIPNGVAVTWSGTIEVPRTGTYTFSACPIDINVEFVDDGTYHQWMTVSIDGQRILDAGPEEWDYEGDPIELEAGTPASIEVAYRYEFTGNESFLLKAPSAILRWEGPGVSLEVVPSGVLRTPDGKKDGLETEYRRLLGDTEEPIGSIVEPTIDRLWLQKENLYCAYVAEQHALVDRLWSQMTDPKYLAASEAAATAAGSAHFLIKKPNLASYLTSARRGEFLALLVERPALIERISLEEATGLYLRFRHGAEEAAVAFLGEWMQSHPNLEPALAEDFYAANRVRIRDLTVQLAYQDRRAFDALMADFLETSNGDCCLPAAYTLAYGFLMRDRMTEWTALLDEKLAEKTLSGDRRVNWLLARAHAEEIRSGPVGRHFYRPDEVGRGQGWIDEARLIAETPETIYRTTLETVSRQVASGNLGSATKNVKDLKLAMSDTALNANALRLESQLAAIIDARTALKGQWQQKTRIAYRQAIQHRLSLAEGRGDSDEADAMRLILDRGGQE